MLSSAKIQGEEILSQTLHLNCLNVGSDREEPAPDEANSEYKLRWSETVSRRSGDGETILQQET